MVCRRGGGSRWRPSGRRCCRVWRERPMIIFFLRQVSVLGKSPCCRRDSRALVFPAVRDCPLHFSRPPCCTKCEFSPCFLSSCPPRTRNRGEGRGARERRHVELVSEGRPAAKKGQEGGGGGPNIRLQTPAGLAGLLRGPHQSGLPAGQDGEVSGGLTVAFVNLWFVGWQDRFLIDVRGGSGTIRLWRAVTAFFAGPVRVSATSIISI